MTPPSCAVMAPPSCAVMPPPSCAVMTPPSCAVMTQLLCEARQHILCLCYPGQFGKVFRATLHKGTPGEVLVAVKTTKTNSTEKDTANFMKEMMVMSRLLHPNIVRFYGVVHEGK